MTKKQAMPYMKLYTTYLDDMDFIELERSTRSRYWDFYLLAWYADAAGDLLNRETGKPLTDRNIALRLRDELDAVSHDLAALAAAGFMTKKEDTWHISRYGQEQDNQGEMRKTWSDRQVKRRSKQNQTNQDESEESEKELNLEEKEIISINQSNQIKLKSHADVTRESRVTEFDRPMDGSSSASYYSSTISNPQGDETLDMHPHTPRLAKLWQECLGDRITPYGQRMINKALYEGLDPIDIADKIHTTASHDPTSPAAYFAECLRELYLDETGADNE